MDEIKLLITSATMEVEKDEKISSSFSLLQKQLKQVDNKIAEFESIKSTILDTMKMLETCKKCSQKECPANCPNKKAIF